MTVRPALVFACAHLCDERLFAPQVAALGDDFDCRVLVFRAHDSLAAMAEALLAAAPDRFTLIGLSLGGYVAFEVMRRTPERVERLALLDTTAAGDSEARRAGRHADIATVRQGGIEALIPELPKRWLLPAHRARADLVALMAEMAKSVGADGQRNQQLAMLGRPDSLAGLGAVGVPTLVACGAEDLVTPVADHEAIAARIAGARLAVVAGCGHLSTIEQPAALTGLLASWLAETAVAGGGPSATRPP
jgi:pimeloyl-ACP methyl ester carboxylesterase